MENAKCRDSEWHVCTAQSTACNQLAIVQKSEHPELFMVEGRWKMQSAETVRGMYVFAVQSTARNQLPIVLDLLTMGKDNSYLNSVYLFTM